MPTHRNKTKSKQGAHDPLKRSYIWIKRRALKCFHNSGNEFQPPPKTTRLLNPNSARNELHLHHTHHRNNSINFDPQNTRLHGCASNELYIAHHIKQSKITLGSDPQSSHIFNNCFTKILRRMYDTMIQFLVNFPTKARDATK